MAKSKAKKMRERLVKQGKNDPAILRGTFGVISGVTQRPEVPHLVQERKMNKHKNKRFDHGDDGRASYLFLSSCFFLALIILM